MDLRTFDPVHDIQIAYRKVLDLMARPGQIDYLNSLSLHEEEMNDVNSSFLLLAMMLLDTEVSFAWVPSSHVIESKRLHQQTYALVSPVNTADYIFISQDATREEIIQAMSVAKIGTLLNPHCSATIILEVEKLALEGKVILSGPGIQDKALVHISSMEDWAEERNIINKRYPMGTDIILIDKQHQIMCLPRTTQILLNKDSN
jgi:alpha-D-ribose 1-methylphosphonate 5-triphosphate synthase subunit PhnH